jgi:hypothetical protein
VTTREVADIYQETVGVGSADRISRHNGDLSNQRVSACRTLESIWSALTRFLQGAAKERFRLRPEIDCCEGAKDRSSSNSTSENFECSEEPKFVVDQDIISSCRHLVHIALNDDLWCGEYFKGAEMRSALETSTGVIGNCQPKVYFPF